MKIDDPKTPYAEGDEDLAGDHDMTAEDGNVESAQIDAVVQEHLKEAQMNRDRNAQMSKEAQEAKKKAQQPLMGAFDPNALSAALADTKQEAENEEKSKKLVYSSLLSRFVTFRKKRLPQENEESLCWRVQRCSCFTRQACS